MADLRGDLRAERHHWLNTYVGVLDGAFWLSDEEQYFTSDIIVRLLDSLCIPERGNPKELSPPVALEVASGYYTVQLSSPRDSGLQRSEQQVVPAPTPEDSEEQPTWETKVKVAKEAQRAGTALRAGRPKVFTERRLRTSR